MGLILSYCKEHIDNFSITRQEVKRIRGMNTSMKINDEQQMILKEMNGVSENYRNVLIKILDLTRIRERELFIGDENLGFNYNVWEVSCGDAYE